jgi:hypothetical protein
MIKTESRSAKLIQHLAFQLRSLRKRGLKGRDAVEAQRSTYALVLLNLLFATTLPSLGFAAETNILGHIFENHGKSRLPKGDIYIVFTSSCCGPDEATYRTIVDAISSDPDVASAAGEYWGREGEITLSLTTYRDRERVITRLQKLVPEKIRAPIVFRREP